MMNRRHTNHYFEKNEPCQSFILFFSQQRVRRWGLRYFRPIALWIVTVSFSPPPPNLLFLFLSGY